MIDGTSQARVLDFGLALAHEAADPDVVVGTLTYIPPEVVQGAQPTPASGLYTFGLISYELITGNHPFTPTGSVNALQAMALMVQGAPVDYSHVPPAIAEVLMRLIVADPFERFQTAQEVIIALRRAAGLPPLAESASVRESFLQAARFVGREGEITSLSDALTRAAEDTGSAWLIGGESGVGKSRLIAELAVRAQVSGAQVVRGRATT